MTSAEAQAMAGTETKSRCVWEGDIFLEAVRGGRNTYVIIFNERHNPSGLRREKEILASPEWV